MKIDLDSPEEKTVIIDKSTLFVRGKVFSGDICDFYDGTLLTPIAAVKKSAGPRSWYDRLLDDEDVRTPVLLKVAKETFFDNDLVVNEIEVLNRIVPPDAEEEKDKLIRYFPRVLQSFTVDRSGRERAALVLPYFEGFVSLADVLTAYPDGVHFEDMVWMVKRVLEGVGYAHSKGVVHASLIPPHVLVHPTSHAAKIIDWSYATVTGNRGRAMSAAYESSYAPEIPQRKPVTEATDLYMVANLARALVGKQEMPEALDKLFVECLDPSPNMRPRSPWEFYDRLKETLLAIVGKPKYRKFVMPEKDVAL